MTLQIDKSILWWFKKLDRKNLSNILLVLAHDGIHVTQKEESGEYFIDGFLSKKDSSIVKYQLPDKKEIQIPIQDFSIFCKILDTFDELINIEISDTEIVLQTPRKKVNYQLINLEFIKGAGEKSKQKYDNIIQVEKKVLESIKKDALLLDAVKITFDHADEKLSVLIDSDMHNASYNIETDKIFEKIVVLPKHTFDETVSVLSEENVELVFSEKVNALQIKEQTDHFFMITTLAGVVEQG